MILEKKIKRWKRKVKIKY